MNTTELASHRFEEHMVSMIFHARASARDLSAAIKRAADETLQIFLFNPHGEMEKLTERISVIKSMLIAANQLDPDFEHRVMTAVYRREQLSREDLAKKA